MKVLVTGGTGFVGSHTVKALLEAGHSVRMLVRSPDRIARALAPLGVDPSKVEHAEGDVIDEAKVKAALAGCDAVIHAASVYALGERRRAEMLRVNVAGTKTVLEAAIAQGCNPVVHVSSLVALIGGENRGKAVTAESPLGRPVGTYQKTKRDSDEVARALQAKGHPVVITYPGSVWGPDDPNFGESAVLAKQIANGLVPLTSRGGFGVVDVRDLAELHARLMKRHDGPKRYPAFGRYIRHTDLHDLVTAAAGVKRANLPMPPFMLRLNLPLMRLIERLHIHLPVTSDGAWITLCDHQTDNSVSERELGVSFRPVEASVRDTVAWVAKQGALKSLPPPRPA